jgi:type I restriction enzyme R subunit
MASNFDFVPAAWQDTRADAIRAESYGRTDPRTTLIYARRVVEQIVIRVYDVERLGPPYNTDLAGRLGDSGFRAAVGTEIARKADALRKLGDRAVHETREVTPQTALAVLRQLHDLLRWAAYNYSATPDAVPVGAAYDPSLIPAPSDIGGQPPLSAAELSHLLATFEAKDAALEAEKATNAALQEQLDRARAEVKAAQAAKAPRAPTFEGDESETRRLFIDTDLAEAGWHLTEDRDREFPVTGMPNAQGKGFVDYVLWGDDGLPLAVIEAKRARRDPAVGQQQAKVYADCLATMTGRRPVIFWSNGYRHWIWDDAGGYPPRPVAGFLTKAELELMVQRRQTRLSLAGAPVDKAIVERHYQTRAVRAVSEAFEAKRREALLVMATGSGKTRTAIALIDLLMKSGWVKRVLFLADRVALVNQAAGAFKAHLPSATTVNLVDEKVQDGRVFVSTYPTMMGLINSTDAAGARRFGPGYFDLIVIDEAHRSVYAKYGAIFDWFDALLVGLTATPKDEVDRNTYALFNLEDGVPTDAYSLDEAVAEGYLVPPIPVSVELQFMRRGIHYNELSDQEKEEWDALDWGEDDEVPTDVNPEELNTWLFNADTVDKALAHLMTAGHKVAGGDRLGKTIIFAKNNAHAEFIRERFDAAYPEYAGHFARVVTYKTEYAQSLIDDFLVKDKAPHIAISVDMLDTGLDVPEIVNLVFFKLVRSVSKFWQMVGRGTRRCPDLYGPGDDKLSFFIFDFCSNLEYFNQPGAGSEGSLQKSLGERLFEARLGLVAALDQSVDDGGGAGGGGVDGEMAALRTETANHLHSIVAGMNVENVVVRAQREWVERYAAPEAWSRLSPQEASDVAVHLAKLPSSVRDEDEEAKRFDLLILRIQLAVLDGDALTADRLRQQVQAISSALLAQAAIPVIAAQQGLLAQVAEDGWWIDVTLPMLELARRRIRGLVRFIEKSKRSIVFTNFEDDIRPGSIVALPGVSVGTNWERFKAKARAYVKDHEDNVAVQKLRRNKQLTPTDLSALEELLVASGAGAPEDIARAREESQGLGLFIRSLVGLDRGAAAEAFSEFLTDSRFTAAEIRFVQLIVEHLTANGVMEARRLYEAPFTDHAPTGPDFLFADADIDRMIVILDTVRAHAQAEETVA